MKLEYIIIAVFAGLILYVGIVYIFNTIKINRKNKPKADEKPKDVEKPKTADITKSSKPSGDGGKVEVESEILTEKPVEKAIKDANISYQIDEAFEKINAERDEYIRTTQKTGRVGRLKVDREDFESEIKTRKYANRNVLKSQTAEIGHEGPTKKENSVSEKKDIVKHTDQTSQTIADEIGNMSKEAKAILINDILNKKYD